MAVHYNVWLVALSVAIAVLASYTTFDAMIQARSARGPSARYWLVGGSVALGLGIWSMHFIGMLAHAWPTPAGYDLPLTLLSIVPAVAAAALALEAIRRGTTTHFSLLTGGASIGAGIIGMHYTGMAALKMPLQYDPLLVVLSCLIAVAAATAALAIGLHLQSETNRSPLKQLAGALVLGAAIVGMHYTAVAAVELAPGGISFAASAGGVSDQALAVMVGLGSAGILVIVLIVAAFDTRLASERAAACERLARANTQLERFAHMASHDLKEPLTTITGFAQLIERDDSLSDKHRQCLRFISESAARMHRLIDDLLAFSKASSASAPAERVDVEELLAQVEADLAASIRASGAQITHDPLPAVRGRPGLLAQVLQNLLSNAIKFGSPERPPEIHIRAERDGAYWSFEVRDNGIGIEPQYLERVFEMFYRLHRHERHEGTGLGLAFVRKVVEHHGGEVGVESTPGVGTTFRFTLPAADTEPRQLHRNPPSRLARA
jgi:signal transduction histidine kinase